MTGTLMSGLMALLVTAGVSQATVAGRWQGTTAAAGSEIVLELTEADTAVTGTLTRNGEIFKISDGKVSKNRFTFKATIRDQPEGFTAEVSGDEMKIWLDRRGPESATLLKRVKKQEGRDR